MWFKFPSLQCEMDPLIPRGHNVFYLQVHRQHCSLFHTTIQQPHNNSNDDPPPCRDSTHQRVSSHSISEGVSNEEKLLSCLCIVNQIVADCTAIATNAFELQQRRTKNGLLIFCAWSIISRLMSLNKYLNIGHLLQDRVSVSHGHWTGFFRAGKNFPPRNTFKT